MCRIAGIINPSIDTGQLQALVKEMCFLLQHGGPDDEGIYNNPECHLSIGHRRLSIIDITAGGHQPMLYAQGRYVISYNGELYNYRELKKELVAAGLDFKTNSDTEVIVAAWSHWGPAALDRLSGMFAFAIWDNLEKKLLLARDFAGIKPLYYAFTKDGFAFASEVKAFATIPWLQEPNDQWPVYFLAYGHLPEPITTLKNVQPLGKGNYLIYNFSAHTIQTKSFARYKYLELVGNRAEAVSLVKSGLDQAVKKHLISDAPIGVFLSGGLDSSIIAVLAAKYKSQLKTTSIYFENEQYSEKKYQDILQQQLSSGHQQHLIKENDFHACLPGIAAAMDLPCCDGINTWFISRYAKESGLKTVLSGIGGDELFGGYPSFSRMNAALSLENLGAGILKKTQLYHNKKFRRIAYLSIGGAVGRYLFLRGQFVPVDIAKFLNIPEAEVWNILSEQPQLPAIDYLSAGNQAGWIETNLYLQNQLLRDADVMSMAHGIEIRVPFLDKEFVETVLKIKSAIKYSGKLGKQLLIDSFKEEIPAAIWNRPKMGFSFPFKEWLSNDQYAVNKNGRDISVYHHKLKSGDMHWSQFFTLYFMTNYARA